MTGDGRLEELRRSIDAALDRVLPPGDAPPPTIHAAMRYAVEGGKRLRPLLLLAAASAAGREDLEALLPAACAVELIHAYSLVHDDLPSMDDDAFRRGRPTCHRVYGEGLAVLTGDALLTLAFRLLAEPVPGLAPARQLALVREVAEAAGTFGLIGGQVADLASREGRASLEGLREINRLKTGALFRAAARAGGLLAEAPPAVLEALTTFGERFGEAFQILDDLADGGPLPALVGEARARALAEEALRAAGASVEALGPRAALLHALVAALR